MNQRIESASKGLRPARRPWWRFFVQYSLRTLLIATTLAAVACWWWLQPETRREERGSKLTLQRQVRPVPTGALVRATPKAPARREMRLANVGHWRLRDEHDELLAAGRYQDDRPHGWWTTYHANGRKAVQGQTTHGARSGVWRVWDEQGRRESAVTYRAVEQRLGHEPAVHVERHRSPGLQSVIPVVGMLGPLGQLSGVRFSSGGRPDALWISQRHGPAKAWHAAGPLAEEGNFDADRRHGLWKFYDEQGRLLKTGEFVADLRDGQWTIGEAGGGPARQVEFVGGRLRAEHERLLAQVQADLAAGPIDRQMVALDRLADLGRHGLPLLLATLDRPQPELQLLALQRCTWLASAVEIEAGRPRIEQLMDSPTERVAAAATLLAYRNWPDRRTRLSARLLAIIRQSDDLRWQMAALNALFEFEPAQRTQNAGELALVVERWRSQRGSSQSDWQFHLWIASEWLSPEFPAALIAAMESSDPRVRCGVLALIDAMARQRPPQTTPLPGGGQQVRYAIPEAFAKLVERAMADPDSDVRAAAQGCGLPFYSQNGNLNFSIPGLTGGMF